MEPIIFTTKLHYSIWKHAFWLLETTSNLQLNPHITFRPTTSSIKDLSSGQWRTKSCLEWNWGEQKAENVWWSPWTPNLTAVFFFWIDDDDDDNKLQLLLVIEGPECSSTHLCSHPLNCLSLDPIPASPKPGIPFEVNHASMPNPCSSSHTLSNLVNRSGLDPASVSRMSRVSTNDLLRFHYHKTLIMLFTLWYNNHLVILYEDLMLFISIWH